LLVVVGSSVVVIIGSFIIIVVVGFAVAPLDVMGSVPIASMDKTMHPRMTSKRIGLSNMVNAVWIPINKCDK